MTRTIHLRQTLRDKRFAGRALCCLVLAMPVAAYAAQGTAAQPSPGQSPTPSQAAAADASDPSALPANEPKPSKSQLHQAEEAYITGAKKLDHDDMDAAEAAFKRAQKLDPANRTYAIAISVAREHRVTELVRQASKARQAGESAKAETLLAQARMIDPSNPLVVEHSGSFLSVGSAGSQSPPAAAGNAAPGTGAAPSDSSLANRAQMLAGAQATEPWKVDVPVLGGPIQLKPDGGVKNFTERGAAPDVLRAVASAFGIRAVVDASVDQKNVRFELGNVTYQQAMAAVMSVTHSFAVPLDETSVLLAKNDPQDRQRLQRQLEETIYLPGSTTEQLNEIANVVRTVFEVKQATVQTSLGSLVVRAPQDLIAPLNRTIEGLSESSAEVMVEVKMYEVDTTRMQNVGAALPSQFSVFNVEQAATTIVNSNQTLVQQAIAQGYIAATASNLEIALALIGSGLVQSNLASNLLGVFGGGLLQTGISASTNTTFNLALNSTDSRSLDDIQIRVGDRQPAIFREGSRYPIITSSYTTGVSTPASGLSSATVNGVSVSNLLSQFSGGATTSIPQITYEDLGLTLEATPVIQKTGRINLLLKLKIEALAGSTNDGNPVLNNRQFASDLTLADGESAMMVSYVTKNETAAMTGIPGLSELPGFQMPTEQQTERDTGQLVVIVTPHIVRRRSNELMGPRISVPSGSASQ